MTSTASPQTDSSSSQAAAARAILQRRALRSLAKRDLSAFVTYFGEHRPAKHHRMLCTTLQMVIEGHLTRAMVFMPPGGAKSTYCSVYAPAFAVGRMPGTALIAGSHTMALARGFGRRVRNTIRDPRYREIFPTVLDPYARAAAEWYTLQTTEGDRRTSSYFAAGVGVGIAGKRGDIAIIDDPFKSRKDADSQVKRDDVWNWYLADVRSRLRGTGGRIVIVNCLTGDTLVLMADGSEKELRDIRPGDSVASYCDGQLVARTVLNWANQGSDRTYKITMQSGITVRGNERHPFLVATDGDPKWTRLKDLRPGHEIFRANGANGKASSAPARDATSQQSAGATAHRTTTKSDGPTASDRHLTTKSGVAQRISSIATALRRASIAACWPNKTASAPCAESPRVTTSAPTGAGSCALTTATTPGRFARFCATTATWWLGMRRRLKSPSQQRSTFDFIRDRIVTIESAGIEDVFDIQVEGTENFIANGLVSHNTRWHEDDLCGRILPEGYNGESGWIKARDGEWWFVISVQAIAERPDDILGRQPGESYWPDYVHIKALEQERISQTPRNWSALYQQRPSPEEGDYYKREWFQWYDTLPRHCHYFGASDYAVTQDGGDWTVHIVGAVTGPKQMESLYLVDYWTGQTSSDVWVEEFIRLVLQWKPLDWAEEQGQISKSLGPYIDTEQTRRRAWTNRKQLAVSGAGDKGARGQAFRALAAQRRVYLPRNAPWAGELLDRLLRFGASSRDDDHDACGLLGRLVYHMHGMAPPPPEAAKPAYGSYDWLLKVTDEQQREAHRSLYHGANRR